MGPPTQKDREPIGSDSLSLLISRQSSGDDRNVKRIQFYAFMVIDPQIRIVSTEDCPILISKDFKFVFFLRKNKCGMIPLS